MAPGVAGDVGERLLHDAVGGQLDGGRAAAAGAVGLLERGRRGRWRARRRPASSRSARRGRGRTRARPSPRRSRSSAVRSSLEGVVAGLLDGGQRRAGLLGLLVEQVQRHAGLHVDQRDVVGQHVVQLLGQREALLAHPAPLRSSAAARPARRPGPAARGPPRTTASTTTSQPATSGQCEPSASPVAVGRRRRRPRTADVADARPAATSPGAGRPARP